MGAGWAYAGAARAAATIRTTAPTMKRFADDLFVLIELPSLCVVGWCPMRPGLKQPKTAAAFAWN
jgi:hypothetical protein